MYTTPSFSDLFSLEILEQAFEDERQRTQEGLRLHDPHSLDFLREPQTHLQSLHHALLSEQYVPTPPRSFLQERTQRRIHLCVLADRIVQRAILWALTPLCETFFLPSSYAYRPKRSAQSALQHILRLQEQGFTYAYRSDIEGFFDNVPHHRMEEALRIFQSPSLTRLILRILQSATPTHNASTPHTATQHNAEIEMALRYGGLPFHHNPTTPTNTNSHPVAPSGLPLGFPLSPLLANLYLHPFDRALYYADLQLIRYADDFAILCKTHTETLEAARFAEKQLLLLQLQPNPEKTLICSLQQGISFLGLTLDVTGLHPAPDALLSLQQHLLDLQQHPQFQHNTTQRHIAMRAFTLRWFQYYQSFANFQPNNPEIASIVADIAEQSGLQQQSQQILQYNTHGEPMKDSKKSPKQSSKHSREHAPEFTQRTHPKPYPSPVNQPPPATTDDSTSPQDAQRMLQQGDYATARTLLQSASALPASAQSSPAQPSTHNIPPKRPSTPTEQSPDTAQWASHGSSQPPDNPTPTEQNVETISPHPSQPPTPAPSETIKEESVASFSSLLFEESSTSQPLSAKELFQALQELNHDLPTSFSFQREKKQHLLYHPHLDEPLQRYASPSQPRPLSVSFEEFEQHAAMRQLTPQPSTPTPDTPKHPNAPPTNQPPNSSTSPRTSQAPQTTSLRTSQAPQTPSPQTPQTSSPQSPSSQTPQASHPHRLAHILQPHPSHASARPPSSPLPPQHTAENSPPHKHITNPSTPPRPAPFSPPPATPSAETTKPAETSAENAKHTHRSAYDNPSSSPPLPPTATTNRLTYARPAPLLISEDVRAQYMALFRVHTAQISRAKTLPQQRAKYETIQRPWDEQAFAEILHGEATYAFFLHDPKKMTCYVSALDIDIHKQAIQAANTQPERTQQHIEALHQWSLQLSSMLTLHGFPMILEESGYRGRHLWIFFHEPIPVDVIRTFWKTALSVAPAVPDCLQVEIFPDIDTLAPTDTDQPIKAPLAIHPISQQRSAFLHPQSGKPLNPHKALMPTFPTSRHTLEAWLLERLKDLQPQDLGLRFATAKRLMDACPLVQTLVQKAYDTRHLTHPERISLLYTFGLLGEEGRSFLHFVIGRTFNYQYAITEDYITKRRPFPISCSRLKDKHSDLNKDIRCRCNHSDLPPGIYPTPLLHILPMEKLFPHDVVQAIKQRRNQRQHPSATPLPTPRTPSFYGPSYPPPQRPYLPEREVSPHLRDANAIMRHMVELRQQRRSLEETMHMLSQSLSEIFDAKEIEQLETDVGLLTRKRLPDGTWEWNLVFNRF